MAEEAPAGARSVTAHGDGHGAGHEDDEGHGHGAIHLPPNSWCPIVLAVGLTALFIGFLVGVWLAVIGALCSAATIAVWVRGARDEYLRLPE